MSTTSAHPVEDARLPSYEELERAREWIRFPAGLDRFVWHLDGPLSSSIWVRETNNKKAPTEPYCQQTESGTTWHPISQMPLTEPKVSSITVHVYDLKEWEEIWVESHGREWTWNSDDEEIPEGIKYGPIPNYNPETDWWPSQSDKRPWHLLECCGTKRPRGKDATIVVKPSLENGFVTIHDYFTTVHPWLTGLRDEILDAIGVMDAISLPRETKLTVEFINLINLTIENKKPQRTITEPYIT